MKRKAIFFLLLAVTVFATSSCKKELASTNKNPTSVTGDKYNPNLLLTTTQLMYTGSSDFGAENWQVEWSQLGGYIQHTASTNTNYYSGDKYLNAVGNFGVYFTHAYNYQVQPAVELYELTKNKPEYSNLHQISRIMKAMIFERLTDLYGDVPYSQGGQGYYLRIYQPVYDKQQDIYADLLKEVSESLDSLDDNADYPTGDVFYAPVGGADQIQAWRRFGNTLLLRMAMRLTKVDPSTAQTYVAKVQNLTMQSVDDDAVVYHSLGNATQNRDTWTILQQDSADLKLCKTFIDSLKDNNDPRLPVFAWVYATKSHDPDDQQGLPPGYIIGGVKPATDITKRSDYPALGMQGYSRFSSTILDYTAPNLVLTYAESEFLLADAAQRWNITTSGTAAEHYKNGVLAAMAQLAVYGDGGAIDEGDAEDYYDAHPYDAAHGLSMINTQFWLSTIMNEYEAWINWRRTGYPELTPTNYTGNVTGGTIPRRLEYPQAEKLTNGDNYNSAVSNLNGGDKLTSRTWWDVP